MSPNLEQRSKDYYDEFSRRYDAKRGGNQPLGYHDLLDDLEVGLVRQYAVGRDLLEVGCGTGLLLHRFSEFAASAHGIDLSPGMLEKARARGLSVTQGSATELPFKDESFDVACSFKVLSHIPDIDRALSEMARVVRPGGHVIAEFYNPRSLRYLAKRLAGPLEVGSTFKEDAVFTRFDTPEDVALRMPPGMAEVKTRGIRIVTPAAFVLRVPGVRSVVRALEFSLCDSPLRVFGGFYVAVWQKSVR